MARHGYSPRRCVDCGVVFNGWGDNQIRCPECQKRRRNEMDRLRHQRIYREQSHKRHGTQSKVVNGHVQICRYLNSCVYGNGNADGCSYALEEGKSRRSQGLWIVDGKCPAYEKKKKGHRITKRSLITLTKNYDPSEIFEV